MAAPEAVETQAASAPATNANVKDTPEFKEAMAAEREQMRLGFDAEYRRKQQELEARSAPPANGGADFFADWGGRHGLPAEAGKELANVVVDYVQGTLVPNAIKPLSASAKRQELRSQRAELRAGNAKLATLDDRFHAEAMRLLEPMDPRLIGPESYARALQMVIGQNIETLEAEREKARAEGEGRQPEAAPGPEPVAASGPTRSPKAVLNAKQQQFCEEKGFDADGFVEMMRERARKLEGNGLSKAQVRQRLGEMLGTIEW